MMDLKALVDGHAQDYVEEARLDKGRGPLAPAVACSEGRDISLWAECGCWLRVGQNNGH
jgi:hypothetical protein